MGQAKKSTILITGGSGYVGRRLVRRLTEQGRHLRLLLRPTSDLTWLRDIEPPPEVVHGDLEDVPNFRDMTQGVRQIIHLAHIRYARAVVSMIDADTERVVFVSSLRALSKIPCTTLDQVLDGEQAASAVPGAVILRPSMIYGPGDDRNISRLAGWLRRRRWLPVMGARHLHQPVYVDDVIDAIITANARTVEGVFAIAGPDPISYAELIVAVSSVLGVRPHLVRIPSTLLIAFLRFWQHLPLPQPVDVAQVRRLLEDKAYDIGRARTLLDFAPRSFSDGLTLALSKEEVLT